MKKLLQIIAVVSLVLVLSSCSAIAQKVVQLPDPLANGITALAVFVVGWLFAQIGNALPWFLKLFGQYADEIAFALAGGVIAFIQNWLNAIPPQWESPANAFLTFLVAVLAALQVFKLLGKMRVKSFRA